MYRHRLLSNWPSDVEHGEDSSTNAKKDKQKPQIAVSVSLISLGSIAPKLYGQSPIFLLLHNTGQLRLSRLPKRLGLALSIPKREQVMRRLEPMCSRSDWRATVGTGVLRP